MSKYRIPTPSHIPWSLWFKVIAAAVLRRRRSPAADGATLSKSLSSLPITLGGSNLPPQGPFVICANHYNGPGIWVGLGAALLAWAVDSARPGIRIRGVGVASYRRVRLFGLIPIPSHITEFVFERFYAVYDVIRMPNESRGVDSRAAAVRAILRALKAGDVVVLFPEGRNVENFAMRRIQPGIGSLGALVSRSNIPVVPSAIFRTGGRFTVSFAKPLEMTGNLTANQIEDALGHHIAQLLPDDSRGAYAL